jgi:sigma-B regulation protein RsbU (phosphoserine phosphatase)
MSILRLDRAQRRLTYSNAGHNPPLLARADGRLERLTSGGTVLGVFPDATFLGGEMPLLSGDRLVLFTDGITEALNPTQQEYGEERLATALLHHRHLDAPALHEALWSDVTNFTCGGGYQDDATLLVVAIA